MRKIIENYFLLSFLTKNRSYFGDVLTLPWTVNENDVMQDIISAILYEIAIFLSRYWTDGTVDGA